MPIDVEAVESPGWWLARLSRKLEVRNRERLVKLDAYRRGDPPLPTGAENAHRAYQAFQRKARLNLAELCVEIARQRMTPTGIRTGAGNDNTGDATAWAWWQANGMDVKFADVAENMLTFGDAYMIGGLRDDQPVITAEDPRQVVTEHDPLDQRQVRAALKLFHDPVAGADLAYVYLPGELHVASRPRRSPRPTGLQRFSAAAWDWDEDRSDTYADDLSDLVPVVRFRNRNSIGEFEQHLDVLDRINHELLQRMVITTMQAFRQRAIKGDLPSVYPKDHPLAGEPIDYDAIFTADPGALWQIPAAAEIWESGQADIRPILDAVKDDILHFAAVTASPHPMFSPDGANQTAEGATFSREALVFRVEDRNMRAKDGLIDILAMAFRLKGDEARARRDQLGILWAPVERRSLTERADAASKAGNDMDVETRLVEIWQFHPLQARRVAAALKAEKAESAANAALGLSALSGFGPQPVPEQEQT